MSHASDEFVSLGAAVLTVSDTRTELNDSSGNYLKQALTDAGHRVLDSTIITDETGKIRERIVSWINSVCYRQTRFREVAGPRSAPLRQILRLA